LGTLSAALSSLRQTVKQNSLRAGEQDQPVDFGSSSHAQGSIADVQDTLTGAAECFGPKLRLSGTCTVRLRGDMLIVEQEAAEGDAEKLIEESVQLTGAHIDCSGTTVSISRNSDIVLRMRHDSEKIAGLWATKMAVACGNAESISKLFSIQRRRIQTLEQNSQEAQLNNEQIERCLNFLSREYVDMRYHVSRAPSRTGSTAQLEEAAKEPTKAFEVEEVDLEDLVQIPHNPQSRHQSEPEKEPLDSARGFRPEHAWEPEKLVPDSELTAKST